MCCRVEQTKGVSGGLTASLVLKGELDREKVDHYPLTLEAVDGGSPPLTGSVQV